MQVSIPGAITGALLAEWLATGKGIGYAIISAVSRARNNEVWASVVVITLVSIILYTVVALLEETMLRRSGRLPSDVRVTRRRRPFLEEVHQAGGEGGSRRQGEQARDHASGLFLDDAEAERGHEAAQVAERVDDGDGRREDQGVQA